MRLFHFFRRATWAVVATTLSLAASAQPATADPGPCDAVLEEAQRLYVEQMYEAAELSALRCSRLPSARPADVLAANRLLTLTYLKRGMLSDARLTVVKILSADSAYRADPLIDLPVYVALVDAVRDQLQVAPSASARPEQTPAPPTARVNVNTASEAELDTVPGIGPALAQRIIAHREQHGPFRSVDGLQEVRGIGPRSIERMAPAVTVTGGVGTGNSEPEAPAAVPEPSSRISINAATQEELESLPGIGPSLAGRIIAFREEHGRFRSTEEVMLVRGIGEKTFEAIADLITAEPVSVAD